MTRKFDYFVVFAEMRTGSNFLEANLNAFPHLFCLGEAFNPNFIGYPKSTEILGVTQAMREDDPRALIRAICQHPQGLAGFRFFHDHDPRVLDIALSDPRCAKIILTRNPVDSYVSWKIAQATNQWMLTNVKRRKDATIAFDSRDFAMHLAALQEFQVQLLNALQTSGQTAFYISYEDLQNLDVINGLARYLGETEMLDSLDQKLKRQNPEPISQKVSNFDEMQAALARLDRFNLTRTPNFEPRRGPAVPSYVACGASPLLYLPLPGGPVPEVEQWMAALDGIDRDHLLRGFTQKTLRQWLKRNRGHRSFTVLRHPVARAHAVFCQRILSTGPDSFAKIRKTLRGAFKMPIPREAPDSSFDRQAHQQAFKAFLRFLKANLAGQTSIRIASDWASQAVLVQGMGQFALPDFILREEELKTRLPALGHPGASAPSPAAPDHPHALADIYDGEIEALVADIYPRDYLIFGFSAWDDQTG